MTGEEDLPFQIRPLRGPADLQECVSLQEEVWGKNFSERVPGAILMVAGRLGGVVAGAYSREGTLLGFVFGLTGLEEGRPVHWSDMLAVRRAWRGRGIGTALKLYQRRYLLALGVDRVYWTFDPLEARNAALNLGRLGAVAREYVPDMYGSPTSPLHHGIGTDRLIAVWDLASPRVEARLADASPPPESSDLEGVPVALEVLEADGVPVPGRERDPSPEALRVLVPVPVDIQELKARAPEIAVQWRKATRSAIGQRLDVGWEVREIVRVGNLARYILVRDEERDASQ